MSWLSIYDYMATLEIDGDAIFSRQCQKISRLFDPPYRVVARSVLRPFWSAPQFSFLNEYFTNTGMFDCSGERYAPVKM
jgi:hypothetical protein